MNFSRKVVHAFFNHDSEKEIINGLYCLIQKFTNLQPGGEIYIETRIKKFCEEYNSVEAYENLVLTAMENINSETWIWNDIARVFWTLHLIDDAARFELSVEDRENFRESMIEKVGGKVSFIDKYQWITMPFLNTDPIPPLVALNSFSWSTFIAGGLAALYLQRFLYKLQ